MLARLLSTGYSGPPLSALQILFARQSITSLGCLLWMYFRSVPSAPFGAPGIRLLLAARGVSGFFGVFGIYYSLGYLGLSDATVITFLSPVVATYACSVIPALREPFSRAELGAGVVSLLGVVMIARPGGGGGEPGVTPRQRAIAVGVALFGVLGAASAYTTIRWIGKRAHPLVSVFYFSAWCTVVSFVGLMVLPGVGGVMWPQGRVQWGLLGGIGVTGFVMQFLLTSGLQREKAGRGTNMLYTQMLFALMWEKLVWGTTPVPWSWAGSVLILGSAVWVGTRKRVVDEGKGKAVDEERGKVDEESALLGEERA